MTPTRPTPREILRPWQRHVVRVLVVGFVLVAGTGVFLAHSDGASNVGTWALIAHVAVGMLLLPVLLVFVVPHALEHMRRKPGIAFTGALVLFGALACTVTGVQMGFARRALHADWIRPTHWMTGIGMVVCYAMHRRYGASPASWSRLAVGVAAFVAVALALVGWEASEPASKWALQASVAEAASSRAELLLSRSAVGGAVSGRGALLDDARLMSDVARCGECHAAIVRDHERSAHKQSSFNNPFYRGSIKSMRARYPLADTKWCAGCHDPALLFTGTMDDPHLDMDSVNAQMGLTCLSCHAVEPQSHVGNGDYVLRKHRVYAWELSDDPNVLRAHDVLLRMKPRAHAESLTPGNIQSGEFCSTCHKATVPVELNRWHLFRAQTEYDDWHNSGVCLNNVRSFYHPLRAKICADCHMPKRLDPSDPSADANGYVASHLFAAANTALPFLRGDHDMIEQQRAFLRTAMRVDIAAVVLVDKANDSAPLFVLPERHDVHVQPGQIVEAHVSVRNLNVGHKFPGGTADSNEAWIEFTAAADDTTFFHSGKIDPKTGLVDPTAEHYRAYAMTRDGKRFVSRVGLDVLTPLYSRRINPGTADVARYRFRVPRGVSGDLKLKATLRYRKFMRPYINFLFPDSLLVKHRQMDGSMATVNLAHLPIVDMAQATLRMKVTGDAVPTALPARNVAKPGDRVVVNDLGIAYLLQGDPRGALALFQEVTAIEPDYADGWVNVARAYDALRRFDLARKALAMADRLKPGWAKSRYFEGLIQQKETKFEAAEKSFKHVLETFPKDRETLRRLADVQWNLDKPKDALVILDRLFEIDPEDANGWRIALACYKALGDEDAIDAAERAWTRFRPDDTLRTRAGPFLVNDTNILRLAQPIHKHVQPGAE